MATQILLKSAEENCENAQGITCNKSKEHKITHRRPSLEVALTTLWNIFIMNIRLTVTYLVSK